MLRKSGFAALALCMILAVVCCAGLASAEDQPLHVQGDVYRTGDFLYRVLADGTAEITSYVGQQEVWEIPETIGGCRVSAIGERAFSNEGWIEFYTDDYPDYLREYIRRIRVPEGVTRIGAYAFEHCFTLVEVVLPESLEEIGEGAFDQCDALMRCELPARLRSLGAYAFRGCLSMSRFRLPDTLTEIGANPFAGCAGLQELAVSPEHPFLRCAEGMLFDAREMRLIGCTAKAWTLPEGIRVLGDCSLAAAPLTAFEIPASVEELGNRVFDGCKQLKALTIPATVRRIGDNPVSGCLWLEELHLSEGQSRFVVRDSALIDTQEARLITFLQPPLPPEPEMDKTDRPTSLPAYGGTVYAVRDWEYSWEETGEPEVQAQYRVPEGIAIIGGGAFYGARVREITLPDSVRELGDGAFENCEHLESCPLPAQITRLPDRLFSGCRALRALNIPAGTVSVGAYALYDTALEGIEMPASLTELGPYAFAHCSYQQAIDVVFSPALTRIPKGAFCGCGLRAMDLPEGVTEIGQEAFSRTQWLEKVHFPAGITAIADFCFYDCPFLDIELPPQLEYIGDMAFRVDDYQGGLMEAPIVIPDSVRLIGNQAFRNQSALTAVTLPAGLVRMGDAVFYCCYNLSEVKWPEGISRIPARTFMYSGLKQVDLPESLTWIGEDAFEGCPMTSVAFTGGDVYLAANPFENQKIVSLSVAPSCSRLRLEGNLLIDPVEQRVIAWLPLEAEKTCTVPEGIAVIGADAFQGIELEEIILPESLRRIESGAFYNCDAWLNLPDQLEWIGTDACIDLLLCRDGARLPSALRGLESGAIHSYYMQDAEIILPDSLEWLGIQAITIGSGKIVFPDHAVTVEGRPFYARGGLEIVLPENHPTLEMEDGNLYSREDHRLIAQLTDAPIREGTVEIAESALLDDGKTPIILPESVEMICVFGWEREWSGSYVTQVYAVPGSAADAYFRSY